MYVYIDMYLSCTIAASTIKIELPSCKKIQKLNLLLVCTKYLVSGPTFPKSASLITNLQSMFSNCLDA